MSFLNYGSIRGLSLAHDYGRDIDRLYEREKFATEIRKEKENKARYYGELLQKQQATTPYNTRRLETYYDDLTQELADFVISNPNFETDINLQREFQDIAQRFQDNDIIREDMQVAQALDLLKQEVATGDMDGDDFIYEMDKYRQYAEHGGDPYVFENFKKVYLTDIVSELAEVTATVTGSYTDPETGMISDILRADPEALDYVARMALTRSDYDRTVHKAYQKAKSSGLYDSKLDFLKKIINAQISHGSQFRGWSDQNIDGRTRAQLQAEFNQNNVLFGTYVLDELFGENGYVKDDNKHVVFSPWREEGGHFNPSTYTGGEGDAVKFQTYVLNNKKVSENDPEYIAIDMNNTVAATGAGRLFRDENGVPFVEIDVAIPILEGQNKRLRDQLSEYGFTASKYSDSGRLQESLAAIEGIRQTSDVYQGTIVVPASFSAAQIHDYERGWKTDTKAMEVASVYPAYAQEAEYLSAQSKLTAEYPNAGGFIRAVSREGDPLLKSKDGKVYYNLKTKERVIIP